MDKQAWQATVHGVAKSGTQLEGLSVQSQEIILPKKKKLNIFLIFLKKEKGSGMVCSDHISLQSILSFHKLC